MFDTLEHCCAYSIPHLRLAPCNESSCTVGTVWHHCGVRQGCSSLPYMHTPVRIVSQTQPKQEGTWLQIQFSSSLNPDQPDHPICPKRRLHKHLSIRKIHLDQVEMLVCIINEFASIIWLCPSVPLLFTSQHCNPTHNSIWSGQHMMHRTGMISTIHTCFSHTEVNSVFSDYLIFHSSNNTLDSCASTFWVFKDLSLLRASVLFIYQLLLLHLFILQN